MQHKERHGNLQMQIIELMISCQGPLKTSIKTSLAVKENETGSKIRHGNNFNMELGFVHAAAGFQPRHEMNKI